MIWLTPLLDAGFRFSLIPVAIGLLLEKIDFVVQNKEWMAITCLSERSLSNVNLKYKLLGQIKLNLNYFRVFFFFHRNILTFNTKTLSIYIVSFASNRVNVTYGCFPLQFKLNIMLRDKCVRTFSVMWKKKLSIDILLTENKKIDCWRIN